MELGFHPDPQVGVKLWPKTASFTESCPGSRMKTLALQKVSTLHFNVTLKRFHHISFDYKIISVEAIDDEFLDQLSHEMQETEVPIMIVEEESPRAIKLNLDTQLGQHTRSSPESSEGAIRMIRM